MKTEAQAAYADVVMPTIVLKQTRYTYKKLLLKPLLVSFMRSKQTITYTKYTVVLWSVQCFSEMF